MVRLRAMLQTCSARRKMCFPQGPHAISAGLLGMKGQPQAHTLALGNLT